MKPLKHQEKFVKDYQGKNLLVHEGGTGKTVCACLWLKDGRDLDALIVCPKKVVNKWKKALKDWGTKGTVISKEDFKKYPNNVTHHWSARVIDEADEFASPLFVAKNRSALTTAAYTMVKNYPNTPTLLLTATPIRSNPWNLHTLLCLMGNYIDHKKWRDYFFELKYPGDPRYRYLQRPAYIPRDDWRTRIRPTLEKYADIVLLKDCVGELPAEEEEKIKIKTPTFELKPDSKVFFDEHRHEQQNKAKEIIEIGKEYRKILVVAYYREQIEELYKQLSKDKPTFLIYGGIKDQEKIIEQAQEADDCYFIVQASIGAGFDADKFSCIVFASMSYAVRDYVQMKFRVRRIHNLHPVKYIYLIGGRCDRAVLENIEAGKEFVPSEWCKLNK
jgi:superfamily II DNA or RNA helicase